MTIDLNELFDEKSIRQATRQAKASASLRGLKKKHGTGGAAGIEARAAGNRGVPRNRKPCTIDGVKIYPSLSALMQELGQGAKGAKHPNFRYID